MKTISESDVAFETMRSGGPGGQHGDRRETAVRLRVNIADLPLNDTEERFVREHLPPKNRTSGGELIVQVGEHRSQKQNKKAALAYAAEELEEAIKKGKQEHQETEQKQDASNGGGGGASGDDEEKRKRQRRRKRTDDYLREAYEEDPETIERFMN